MAAVQSRPRLVINVSGGVVSAVYTDAEVEVILVDWDNINEGDDAGPFQIHPLSEMPEDVAWAVDDSDDPEAGEGDDW